MEIEDYIEKIVDNGRVEDMKELSDMLEDTMEIINKYDEQCYKEMEMKLYKMAYGNVLSRKMAEEIVHKMRPSGMRWTFEETKNLQRQYGVDNINSVDFFIVMNSAFNDYRDLFQDNVEDYMKFTIDFIEDEDAKQDKVFLYYTTIPLE
jgi:hypothetical protein